MRNLVAMLGMIAFITAFAGQASAWPQFANETGAQCSFCHQGPPANKVFTQQGNEFRQYLINQGRLPGCKKVPAYDANGNYIGTIEQCN